MRHRWAQPESCAAGRFTLVINTLHSRTNLVKYRCKDFGLIKCRGNIPGGGVKVNILLVGATGLVGQELGRRLTREGHQLWVLTRDVARAREQLSFPFTGIVWREGLISEPQALGSIEAVCYLAGESVAEGRWNAEQKARILNSRVAGLEEVLRQVTAYAPQLKTVVSASAIGYYGDRSEQWCREADAPGVGFLSEVCEKWEKALFEASAPGVRKVALRIGMVLSDQGGALPIITAPLRFGPGAYLGRGQQWVSWIHLDDLVEMFLLALQNTTIEGSYNAVAPQPERHREFMKQIAATLGSAVLFAVPDSVVKLMFGEKAALFLQSQRVSCEKIQGAGFAFKYADLSSALKSLLLPLKDADKTLTCYTYIPRSRAEVFTFFCDEKNLEVLTPDFLNFEVLGKSTEVIQGGTFIDYRLRLYGIPVGWKTEISKWSPGEAFIDEQVRGPYKKWHHEHSFSDLGEGTLMRDRVEIKLPYGWLGRVMLSWKIFGDVNRIFAYRQKKILQLFGRP